MFARLLALFTVLTFFLLAFAVVMVFTFGAMRGLSFRPHAGPEGDAAAG